MRHATVGMIAWGLGKVNMGPLGASVARWRGVQPRATTRRTAAGTAAKAMAGPWSRGGSGSAVDGDGGA